MEILAIFFWGVFVLLAVLIIFSSVSGFTNGLERRHYDRVKRWGEYN